TAQGASDDSCWARGQAWGIYGMMLTYKYHKSDIAMERFKKITDYYISLLPQDYVPFWDMIFGDGSGEPRDSSAAAIAVCGILEAVKYMQGEEKEKYLAYANKMMASLINDYLCWGNDKCNGLLLHASYAVPQNAGVDECNIWGDYFFMEALIRFVTENKWELYW
ncbi:MAG: glycoside hydrolase family 88 protein, partial [Clostridiales bacterium]|nr:glycoside hydrolase family 88 protein [Clostridiales bacterium]